MSSVINSIKSSRDFFKSSWIELKKVHFPGRKDTIAITIRVMFLILLIATMLGVTDWCVGSIVKKVMDARM